LREEGDDSEAEEDGGEDDDDEDAAMVDTARLTVVVSCNSRVESPPCNQQAAGHGQRTAKGMRLQPEVEE
jgi:hypothetical protein